MQAIVTKYLPATNTKGARIKATCEAGSVTVPYQYSSSIPHAYAADALIVKLGWTGEWVEGVTSEGSHVFVPADGERFKVR